MALSHSPQIVRDGLVLYLDAANIKSYPGSGTSAIDLSSAKNNGTLVSGTSFSTDNGGSFVFDGIDDRIDCNNPGLAQRITISSWVKCTNVAASNNIVSKNGPYFMRIVGSVVRFNILTSVGSWLFQNGTTTLSNNVWYNLVMVYDGAFFKGYINSNPEFSVSKTGDVQSNAALYIGFTPQGGENAGFNGSIAQVSIYHKALTDNEIKQNFEALRGRYGI
jgi:hypothetical protein